MYESIRRVLSRPRADLWLIFLGTLLASPSLFSGLGADDYFHELELSSNPLPGLSRSPLDLFRFASPATNHVLVNEGILPWWIDPNVRFVFFRPLASATHWFDHLILPGNAVWMHLHTLAWAVVALFAVRRLFLAIHGRGWLAVLALAIYALDDARGTPVTWIANRHEIIACGLSIWALVWYREGRAGRRAAAWFAPLAFAAALLASEGALAITAYLFASEVFLEEGPLTRRLARLWPFAGTVLIWGATYRGLGFGIAGSGLYFDPLRDPGDFLRALPERFAALWFAQLGGPWSEGWNAYSVLLPGLQYIVAAVAVAVIGGVGILFWPLFRTERTARFWLLGATLGTLPACGSFPADRLLPWIAVGASALTAQFFVRFVDGPSFDGLRGRVAPVAAFAVVVVHLVLRPLLLPFRSTGIAAVRAAIARADETIPSTPDIEHRIVIYLNPAADPFAAYIPVTRAALGAPLARAQHWLATSAGVVHVTRVDETTLRVRQDGGYLVLPSERLFRNTRKRPFAVGDRIELDDFRVTISKVTSDGRPLEILARFHRPLEDPRYVWLKWHGSGYAPFVPPHLGESDTEPKADFVRVAYGPSSLLTKFFGKPVAR